MAPEPSAPASLVLPVLVFGQAAVHQLQRELERLEEFMRQEGVREPGKQAALPKMSRLLEALAAENHLNLLRGEDRRALADFLAQVSTKAPRLHISFATDPSAAFTAKVVDWLRRNIDPYTLVQVGLQPTIAAGCIVRSHNKIFNFSLRHRLDEQEKLLLKSLDAQAIPAAAPAPAPKETQLVGGVEVSA